jgi:hypothetical protein
MTRGGGIYGKRNKKVVQKKKKGSWKEKNFETQKVIVPFLLLLFLLPHWKISRERMTKSKKETRRAIWKPSVIVTI